MNDVRYIVINYNDSDFSNEFSESAKDYCERANGIVQYCKELKIDPSNSILKFLTDRKYINTFISNKVIGNYIKNVDFSEIISITEFQNLTNLVLNNLMADIKFLSNKEFKDIEKDLGYSEYLVIYFENEVFNYKIY